MLLTYPLCSFIQFSTKQSLEKNLAGKNHYFGKNSQTIHMTCVYFCWDEWEVLNHHLFTFYLFTATSQNPNIILLIHDPILFYLFSYRLCLSPRLFVLFTKFWYHLICLTFSICCLVFYIVNMCQILIELFLTNLTIIWTWFSDWKWLEWKGIVTLGRFFS